jgi:hypothetical protein
MRESEAAYPRCNVRWSDRDGAPTQPAALHTCRSAPLSRSQAPTTLHAPCLVTPGTPLGPPSSHHRYNATTRPPPAPCRPTRPGGHVSCEGENTRPRKIFVQLPGGKPATRCACMQGDGWSDVRQVYPKCSPSSQVCQTSPPSKPAVKQVQAQEEQVQPQQAQEGEQEQEEGTDQQQQQTGGLPQQEEL